MNDNFIGENYKKELILVLDDYTVYRVINELKARAVSEAWKRIKR